MIVLSYAKASIGWTIDTGKLVWRSLGRTLAWFRAVKIPETVLSNRRGGEEGTGLRTYLTIQEHRVVSRDGDKNKPAPVVRPRWLNIIVAFNESPASVDEDFNWSGLESFSYCRELINEKMVLFVNIIVQCRASQMLRAAFFGNR